ncbi:MAG: ArsR/SmtB family transcription factor [Aggregatilineales bacterium]
MSGKVLRLDLTRDSETVLPMLKALSSETRLAILAYLGNRPVNINDIAETLQIAASSATTHIQILEKAGLIVTEVTPATRGLQKLCARTYDDVQISLTQTAHDDGDTFSVVMPIGNYSDFEVYPTCGLVGDTSLIGLLDSPTSFCEPEHVHAQLLWFRYGYVTYRFPNHLPLGTEPVQLDLSAELCSEAPLSHSDWPSDITLSVNGTEIGSWTSPADFGGRRGLLTPSWWDTKDSQYGLLKSWAITERGTFLDDQPVSNVTIGALQLEAKPFIEVRLGVKPDAQNIGGLNLFGERFGNHPQPLILKVKYRHLPSHLVP